MRREQEPLGKKLKLLVLFNPLLEWLDATHYIRLFAHDKTIRQGKPNFCACAPFTQHSPECLEAELRPTSCVSSSIVDSRSLLEGSEDFGSLVI
jgi:hypothetical protein